MPAGVTPEKDFTELPHSMTRRTIARRLTESKQSIPHFYARRSCQIDRLLEFRAELNLRSDERVSVNDLVVRAVALALLKVPEANVQFGDTTMRRFSSVDVAVAVATPRGLVAPIVRHADRKSVVEIASEIKSLAKLGKEGKLKPEQYTGGQTSVSNLGMFGVEEFSAIINPPQASIFAIGAGVQRFVPIDGHPALATVMSVTASFDHRAIDGVVGAQLLQALNEIIEAPAAHLG